jgi:biotin carboxylase
MTDSSAPAVIIMGTDLYALASCRRQGFEVVMVRGFEAYDSSPVDFPEDVTVLLVEDQRNPEDILSALDRAGLRHRRFAGIQTSYERYLTTIGLLAQHLGCRAIDPDTAVRFRDKWIQKREIRRAGIPAAQCNFVPDLRDLEHADQLPYPRAVLKPYAGGGAALTAVVSSPAELRQAARTFRGRQRSARHFVLEEYIDGDEWVADGIVADGRVEFVAMAAYAEPCVRVVENQSPLMVRRLDPTHDAEAYTAAEPVVQGAISALGLRDGVFHMELFHQPETGRVVFGECGARRGGGLVQEAVLHKFGVDLADAEVRCAVGAPLELAPKVRPEAVGSTHLMAGSGILVGCPTPDEVMTQPGVVFALLDMPHGSTVKAIESTSARVGRALVVGDSPDELLGRMEAVNAWFGRACQVAPAGATKRELIQWQQATWPDAGFGPRTYSVD